MNFAEIINDIQDCIFSLQSRLDELKCTQEIYQRDIYITRQEAADLLGKGLRQTDRDCVRYGIKRKQCNNGIRISKRDILCHLGLLEKTAEEKNINDFDRIMNKRKI